MVYGWTPWGWPRPQAPAFSPRYLTPSLWRTRDKFANITRCNPSSYSRRSFASWSSPYTLSKWAKWSLVTMTTASDAHPYADSVGEVSHALVST